MVTPVLSGHLSAWLTAAFAALLLMLTVSDQGPSGAVASRVILVAAVAVLGVFLATERAMHRGKH